MTEEVDMGPVISQEVVVVLPDDTEKSLHKRLRPIEHRLLVRAVEDYFWGKVRA
jgi:phosphoribosylglycinamide formyltransferase-1